MSAGTGTEVVELIGGIEDFAVMFDEQDGVAEIAEAFNGGDQATIVTGVESDGGFVEDVEHAGE